MQTGVVDVDGIKEAELIMTTNCVLTALMWCDFSKLSHFGKLHMVTSACGKGCLAAPSVLPCQTVHTVGVGSTRPLKKIQSPASCPYQAIA